MRFSIVLTTCPDSASANKIAKFLVQHKLAACVQITGPIRSHYRWKKTVQSAREVQLWIKTRRTFLTQIEKEIRRIHPYEVPEFLAIDIHKGSTPYLSWLERETSPR
jgi:periplasmic divalent cation tolerance protein